MFYALDGAILWRAVGILDPEHISPDDLTARLRANGVLPTGRVTAVHPGERRPTIISMIIPLRLDYSADAPPDTPTRMILKADRPGLDPSLPGIGEREVMFYRRAAPVMPGSLLARCFDAEYSDGRFHILLEDLSETHTILTQWPLPPSDEACAQIIDAWAAVHAVWWRHPQLGHDIGTFLDDAAIAKTAADVRARYARFADALGDRLWPRARRIYERVFESYEQLYTPARIYSTYTLVHGDAHIWNLLYPRDGLGAGIRLIDWDSWRVGRAASDLAYMMAVHWYPERRARLEASLLARYHATLCAHGVTGYGLDRLREDYRLLVIAHLTTPVWQQSFGLHAMIWWPHLNRIVAAFEDLDCEELMG